MLEKLIQTFDDLQQRHAVLGFPYAVIRKYSYDQVGHQSALLTYYGFLSLFPLLLVLTTLVDALVGHHTHVELTVVNSITDYFPVLGNQLSEHIQSLHRGGAPLIVGIIFTLYGVRGVADVFRNAINQIWLGSDTKRDGFRKSAAKSFTLIIVGGIGFMIASLLAGYAGAVGHGLGFRALSLLINLFILFCLFTFFLNISLPRHITLAETRSGAAVAAIGLVVLQSLGSYLLARELKNLDALYSTFAIALGLLFWLYLQAQVFYYAVEIASVRSQKLWPRAINSRLPSSADKRLAER